MRLSTGLSRRGPSTRSYPLGESEKRKIEAIEVIAQVENLGKARAREPLLVPRARVELGFEEPGHPAPHARVRGAEDREETHGAPRGLARGRGSASLQRRILIAVRRLTEGAVLLLHILEPPG